MSEKLTELTPKKRELFLSALSKGASVAKAAAAAKMTRQGFYKARKNDDDFARDWDEAVESGADILEDEALRRAKDGTLKPVFHQGVQVGSVREYSDTLMIFLLKGRRPEKYRDKLDLNLSKLTDAELLNLATGGAGGTGTAAPGGKPTAGVDEGKEGD
jgi:hypothetical protein